MTSIRWAACADGLAIAERSIVGLTIGANAAVDEYADWRGNPEKGHNLPIVNWLLIFAFLVGAFFRCNALGLMNDMLHYDEAYNGMDALSILRHPRLTPFFPGNYGREAGWIYTLVPFVAALGAQPFALRLAAAFVGVLTLAALYRLGTEVLGKRAATWATATLVIFYWPMHLNHLALRANLLPLVGALAFAALFRARRTKQVMPWIIAGVLVGLLIYTYYSALFWIIYAFVFLAWVSAVDPQRRKLSLLALCTAAVVCLPMILYTYAHPVEAASRIEMVGTLGPNEIRGNAELWLKAWFQRGDPNAEFNLPGRPILDPALGILFLAGLAAVACSHKRRRPGLWILGLAAVSILPSLFSNQSPHFLRAIGLTVPIALITGVGAWTMQRAVQRVPLTRLAALVPLGLLVLSGAVSYRDFYGRWLQDRQVPIFMEQHINQAINYIRDYAPADAPVYFSPFTLSHPVLAFRGADLTPRRIGAFDSHYCMVISDGSATYFSLTLYEPAFAQQMVPWADLTVLHEQPMRSESRTMYTVFQATAHLGLFPDNGQGATVFGDAVQMRLLSPLAPTASAGQSISITLGLRALHPLQRDYSVFVHLYGDPSPYEGGVTWAQGDSQACATYASHLWRTDETIVQDFVLRLPPDLPPGTYSVAVGIYESPAGPRLAITWPAPRPNDFVELQKVAIQRPPGSP